MSNDFTKNEWTTSRYRLNEDFLRGQAGGIASLKSKIKEFVSDHGIKGLGKTYRADLWNANGVEIHTFLLACQVVNALLETPRTCAELCRDDLPTEYRKRVETFSPEFLERYAKKKSTLVDATAPVVTPDREITTIQVKLVSPLSEEKPSPHEQNANEAETDALVGKYLRRLVNRFEMVTLPVRDEALGAQVPLDKLFIDLPLTSESNVIRRDRHLYENTRQARVVDRPKSARLRTLPERLGYFRRVVIVGAPGCGKSTLLANDILEAAKSNLAHLDSAKGLVKSSTKGSDKAVLPLPVTLVCRELVHAELTSIESVLRCQLEQFGFGELERKLLSERFLNLLGEGSARLFVDGLDELPLRDGKRVKFCQLVSDLAMTLKVRFCATSSVVGFRAIADTLIHDDVAMVDFLDPQSINDYAKKWAALDTRSDEPKLIRLLMEHEATDSLTRNILMLTILVQFIQRNPDESSLPRRRVEILDQLFQLLICRRPPASGKPLSANEVRPHLEFIALSMHQRAGSVIEITDNECLELIQQARDSEPDEPELKARSCLDFLNALIDDAGLLHVVGTELDDRGYERRVLRFFHHTFQSYFIGQAVAHRRGGHVDFQTQIAQLLTPPEGAVPPFASWPIRYPRGRERQEPVVAERSQETISFAIASLDDRDEAERAVRFLLPTKDEPGDMQRAKAVLTLQVLADEPNISDNVALDVLRAAASQLRVEDQFNETTFTRMDFALRSVFRSRFGDLCKRFFRTSFVGARGDEQRRIARCLLPSVPRRFSNDWRVLFRRSLETFESENEELRLSALSHLVAVSYDRNISAGGFRLLAAEERARILDDLVNHLSQTQIQPERLLLAWALFLFIGARHNEPLDVPWLNEKQAGLLRDVFERLENDDATIGYLALILTCQQGFPTVFSERRGVDYWAVEFQRDTPHFMFRFPELNPRPELIRVLRNGFSRSISEVAKTDISLALVRLGILLPEAERLMIACFYDCRRTYDERDIAWWYLVFRRNETSRAVFWEASDRPNRDRYAVSRGRFGIVLDGDAKWLERAMLERAKSHLPIRTPAFAIGLAGIADPRGRMILRSHADHRDAEIRVAVAEALATFEQWKAAGHFPDE